MVSNTAASKAVVERYVRHGMAEVMKGNADAIHEYLHDHYIRHTGSQHDSEAKDLKGVKAGIANLTGAMSGMSHRIDHVVADGDMVAVHWHIQGKHTGRHRHRHLDEHLEPTGEDAAWSGMSLYRVEDGKIAESWTYDSHIDYLIQASALTVSRPSG